MRLARLAAVGLAIGVIAGFAIALLRPRPTLSTASTGATGPSGDRASAKPADDDHLWDQFRRADEAPVVGLRSPRWVNG